MGGKKQSSRIKYDAFCIIPKNRTTTFGDRLEQQSAYNSIVTNGYSVEMDGEECDKIVTYEDSCLPIRVTMDRTGENLGDDWSLSSPIVEREFYGIPRWWPKKWFIKPDGSLPNNVVIHYGDIDINLTVINPSEKIVHDSFAETIISQDHDSAVIDNTIKEMGGTVVFKKKKIAVDIEAEPTVSPIIEFQETSETSETTNIENPIKEEKMEMEETTTTTTTTPETTQEQETTTIVEKKNLSKKAKITIGVCTGLVLIGGGILGFLKLRSLRNCEASAE